MPTWFWLVVIALILLIWWLWTNFGNAYIFMRDNPSLVGLGQSVNRYVTDVEGLYNAYEAAASESKDASFFSRLGTFVGALPR